MSTALPQEDCKVCLMIRKTIEVGSRQRLGFLSDITAMDCPHAAFIETLWEDENCPNGSDPIHVHIDAERDGHPPGFDFEEEKTEHWHSSPCHTSWTGFGELHEILLDSAWIDLPLARAWYESCINWHGARCEKPFRVQVDPGAKSLPDWLIDTEEECLVPVDPGTTPIYFTLSYVWGNVDCLKTNAINIDGLKQQDSLHPDQAKNIPWTVRDAMKLTRLLGGRYLWVDSLCIVQDVETTFQRNLHAMHLIYAHSALCLVAEAGHDANYGLRGIERVSSPRWARQITLDLALDFRLFSSLSPLKSTYQTRAWTFQELAFSKRRLIFDSTGRIRWSCSSCKREEETLPSHPSQSDIPRASWLGKSEPSISVLQDVARDFIGRQCTHPGDMLRSFLGVQNHLRKVLLGPMNYGHPETFFEASLAWSAVHGPLGFTRRGADGESENGYLPSWSWMGWSGCVNFLADDEFEVFRQMNGLTEPVAEWCAMDSPLPPTSATSSRRIKCTWYHWKTAFQSETSAVPNGWARCGTKYVRKGGGKHKAAHRPLFRYPIPVPTGTTSLQSARQLPFLFARTTRAYLAARPLTIPPVLWKPPLEWTSDGDVELWSSHGRFGGYLKLHLESDRDEFVASDKIELVAIARGWSVMLVHHAAKDDHASITSATGRRAKRAERVKADCYFVLCIAREANGVAKRRASGRILADVWDEIKEPVDLILG